VKLLEDPMNENVAVFNMLFLEVWLSVLEKLVHEPRVFLLCAFEG
jgi:hypothetical protein